MDGPHFVHPSIGRHPRRFGTEVSFVTWLNVVWKPWEVTEGVGAWRIAKEADGSPSSWGKGTRGAGAEKLLGR